jgi:hypothetical protein
MKKNIPTPLTDEFLQSLRNIREAETDPFFYTRLTARMEKQESAEWRFPLKPVWLVSMLAIFLFINSFFLLPRVLQDKTPSSPGTSLQNFASGYDLSVSTPF